MNLYKPAERQLPNKQAMIDRVLADDERNPRRWLPAAAAAASVAVIAGGALVLTDIRADPKGSDGPTTSPLLPATRGPKSTAPSNDRKQQKPADDSVKLNGGPLSPAVAQRFAAACERHLKVNVADPVFSHAVKVDVRAAWGWSGMTVVITDRATHNAYACAGGAHRDPQTGSSKYQVMDSGLISGPDAASYKSVVNPTDATHPAAPTDLGGDFAGVYLDNSPDSLIVDGWYRVDDRVASMRQRILVNGKPSPWYVADAVDGTVYQTSWLTKTVLHDGDKVTVETQVLGANGQLLDAPADQQNGGGLAPSPGTTRVDSAVVKAFGPKKSGGAEVRWK